MCRIAGYVGIPIRARDIVSAPPHSLYLQSYKPREMQSGTVNADGYGAAMWLDDGVPEPAVYRSISPIWADSNQQWMNERLPVRSVIAAVRSATPGIGYELGNVQPFSNGRVAFTHNGFIEGFRHGPERAIRDSLRTKAYESIGGASDSEHIFALILDSDLRGAIRKLEKVCVDRKAVATIVMGDGEQLTAIRWAHNCEPATLYGAQWGNGYCFASEPLDPARGFVAIPERKIAIARGRELILEDL